MGHGPERFSVPQADGRLSTGAAGEQRGPLHGARNETKPIQKPMHRVHVVNERGAIGAREAAEHRLGRDEAQCGFDLGATPGSRSRRSGFAARRCLTRADGGPRRARRRGHGPRPKRSAAGLLFRRPDRAPPRSSDRSASCSRPAARRRCGPGLRSAYRARRARSRAAFRKRRAAPPPSPAGPTRRARGRAPRSAVRRARARSGLPHPEPHGSPKRSANPVRTVADGSLTPFRLNLLLRARRLGMCSTCAIKPPPTTPMLRRSVMFSAFEGGGQCSRAAFSAPRRSRSACRVLRSRRPAMMSRTSASVISLLRKVPWTRPRLSRVKTSPIG